MSRGRNFSKKPRNNSLENKNSIKKLDSIRSQIKSETNAKASNTNPNTNLYISFGIIAAIVVSGSFIFAFSGLSNPTGTTKFGDANSLTLVFQDLSGVNFDLKQFDGKHIILDIMATWCGPCKEQIDVLQIIKADFPDAVIVSASSDSDDTISKLTEYKNDNGMTWHVLRDVYGVSEDFSVTSIPTLIHITPEYTIKEIGIGVQSYETLESWII